MKFVYAGAALLGVVALSGIVDYVFGNRVALPFAVVVGLLNGFFVFGPLICGHKPFTTPGAAARGERRLGA